MAIVYQRQRFSSHTNSTLFYEITMSALLRAITHHPCTQHEHRSTNSDDHRSSKAMCAYVIFTCVTWILHVHSDNSGDSNSRIEETHKTHLYSITALFKLIAWWLTHAGMVTYAFDCDVHIQTYYPKYIGFWRLLAQLLQLSPAMDNHTKPSLVLTLSTYD